MLFEDWRAFCSIVLLVVFSICLHEYMHARVALALGDPTAADHGHLTLSPFKQMGLVSLFMLALIGIAWGQVPVNPENLPKRSSRIMVALAGVTANAFLIAAFTFAAFLTLKWAPEQQFAAQMFLYGAIFNVVLFLINLLPIPGFDGFLVAAEIIRFRSPKSLEMANAVFFIILLVVFYFMGNIFALAQKLVEQLLAFFIGVL